MAEEIKIVVRRGDGSTLPCFSISIRCNGAMVEAAGATLQDCLQLASELLDNPADATTIAQVMDGASRRVTVAEVMEDLAVREDVSVQCKSEYSGNHGTFLVRCDMPNGHDGGHLHEGSNGCIARW